MSTPVKTSHEFARELLAQEDLPVYVAKDTGEDEYSNLETPAAWLCESIGTSSDTDGEFKKGIIIS